MRCRDAKDRLATQRDALLTTVEGTASEEKQCQEQVNLLENPSSRPYPGISTERIMQAVEQQRRISQQLEDLSARQQERTQLLRRTLSALVVGVFLALGILVSVFVILFFFNPDILVRILAFLSDSMAVPIALFASIKAAWSQIPSNSWLLSLGSLAVVLMMGMWVRLMRSPHEA